MGRAPRFQSGEGYHENQTKQASEMSTSAVGHVRNNDVSNRSPFCAGEGRSPNFDGIETLVEVNQQEEGAYQYDRHLSPSLAPSQFRILLGSSSYRQQR